MMKLRTFIKTLSSVQYVEIYKFDSVNPTYSGYVKYIPTDMLDKKIVIAASAWRCVDKFANAMSQISIIIQWEDKSDD